MLPKTPTTAEVDAFVDLVETTREKFAKKHGRAIVTYHGGLDATIEAVNEDDETVDRERINKNKTT